MKTQLIITIIGADKTNILSDIATAVNQSGCNILDSRMAVFGQDFSLTMIIDGKLSAITRAEVIIPTLCQSRELLSVTKRTSHHEKQNLECLYDLEFSGEDASGLMHKITHFFAQRDISISAFRQRTYPYNNNQQTQVTCKMVLNVARDQNIDELNSKLVVLLKSLNLTGGLRDTHNTKDSNENA